MPRIKQWDDNPQCICSDSDEYSWLYNQYVSEFPDHDIDIDDVLFAEDEHCECKCHGDKKLKAGEITQEEANAFYADMYLHKPDLNKSVIKGLKEKWASEQENE